MYHALIRTHHITSRKKVATLKAAAKKLGCQALLRSGGVPGIMYVSGSGEGVEGWVGVVHGLHYKDYNLVAPPALIENDAAAPFNNASSAPRHAAAVTEVLASDWAFTEVETVKEFARLMEGKGVLEWWRKGMDFTN